MIARTAQSVVLLLAVLASTGCIKDRREKVGYVENQGRELSKITLPDHMIEAPDVLQIDLIAAIPKPPYKLQPLDGISISTKGMPNDVRGVFQIDTDGTVNLGSDLGPPLLIAGMTVPEAKKLIADLIDKTFKGVIVEVALAQSRGMLQVRGPHLVRPDGTVWFENYGAVRVVGMTLAEAKKAVEEHLGQFFLKPEVAISITGYNSKVLYVIFDTGFNGGGVVYRLPVTGNETVLDVISQVGGVTAQADYKRIWIARPAPLGSCPQILPIDWKAITENAEVATNYQMLPGDRLFVKAAPMVSLGARLDRVLAPIERAMGFYLLGQSILINRNINQGNIPFQ